MNDPLKTVVLGLGNILHSDDGVGPRAVEQLRQDERVPKDVTLIEGGTLGLELLAYISDAARLVVLDAVDVGQLPGTLVRVSAEDLHTLPGNGSVHQLGVADLLAGLRILAKRMPEVVLLGIQPATARWGTDLSPAVEAALPRLVAAALDDLHARPETGSGS